jgi:fructoselysine-6-P-deglycase FrlB-like protein
MDPALFRSDLDRKPEVLMNLAKKLEDANPWASCDISATDRIIFLGMGSSHYANSIAAARLQAVGINAVATMASSDLLPQVNSASVVIVVSASGGSVETVHAAQHYSGRCRTIALTNVGSSKVSDLCERHIPLHADPELGGVACRSFQNTVALLLSLQEHLVPDSMTTPLPELLRMSAQATTDLLQSSHEWLEPVSDLLLGPTGTAFVAPARRFSSAQQSALMLREGPRLPAVGCETGDWSHVDVYLTKTTDYRMLLLAGSQWEPALLEWCASRGSTVVACGADLPDTQFSIRYEHDTIDDVRLLTEVLVAELVAARKWLSQLQSPTSPQPEIVVGAPD